MNSQQQHKQNFDKLNIQQRLFGKRKSCTSGKTKDKEHKSRAASFPKLWHQCWYRFLGTSRTNHSKFHVLRTSRLVSIKTSSVIEAFNTTNKQQCLKITALKPIVTLSGAKRTILLNYSNENHKTAHSSVSFSHSVVTLTFLAFHLMCLLVTIKRTTLS